MGGSEGIWRHFYSKVVLKMLRVGWGQILSDVRRGWILNLGNVWHKREAHLQEKKAGVLWHIQTMGQ